ncbi:hypothetical protein CDL12_24534 [Handroanthus impetiginosus]|uniref:GRAM domain-containing protein n=1 Tax=Handroanthus impetiginosus TaxID=429701 RepID=A0A2G9GD77_9LAMI|nr:hypothetical protein CDL12_24534 [Handroanthus impetiginosus]
MAINSSHMLLDNYPKFVANDHPKHVANNCPHHSLIYQVVIPLHQLKAINPSISRTNPAEKYIQVISVDNHEFWYMGFLNYTGAVEFLQQALQARNMETV